jgi:hypothetical protein
MITTSFRVMSEVVAARATTTIRACATRTEREVMRREFRERAGEAGPAHNRRSVRDPARRCGQLRLVRCGVLRGQSSSACAWTWRTTLPASSTARAAKGWTLTGPRRALRARDVVKQTVGAFGAHPRVRRGPTRLAQQGASYEATGGPRGLRSRVL